MVTGLMAFLTSELNRVETALIRTQISLAETISEMEQLQRIVGFIELEVIPKAVPNQKQPEKKAPNNQNGLMHYNLL